MRTIVNIRYKEETKGSKIHPQIAQEIKGLYPSYRKDEYIAEREPLPEIDFFGEFKAEGYRVWNALHKHKLGKKAGFLKNQSIGSFLYSCYICKKYKIQNRYDKKNVNPEGLDSPLKYLASADKQVFELRCGKWWKRFTNRDRSDIPINADEFFLALALVYFKNHDKDMVVFLRELFDYFSALDFISGDTADYFKKYCGI